MTERRLNDIAAELYAQADVTIPLDDVVAATMAAFKQGETITELAQTHPNYSEARGRIYPLFEQDEGDIDHDDTPEGAILELTEGILVEWDALQKANTFLDFSRAYSDLSENIIDLFYAVSLS